MLPKAVTEFIGTFFLTLSISLCVAQSPPGLAPIGIGVVLIAMVYMGGHVSGAHYNPAVSTGVFITKNIPGLEFGVYIGTQVAAALLAAAVGVVLTGKAPAPMPMGDPGAAKYMAALLAEIIFTFALVLVVLHVACAKKCAGNGYYGVAIGLTVMAGAFAIGPVSGAALNPAVAVGLVLIRTLRGEGGLSTLWIYLLGPIVGALLAAPVFKLQTADAPDAPAEKPEEDERPRR